MTVTNGTPEACEKIIGRLETLHSIEVEHMVDADLKAEYREVDEILTKQAIDIDRDTPPPAKPGGTQGTHVNYRDGSITLPMNRMVPVKSSRIKKINGLSIEIVADSYAATVSTTTAVAAAASVPSSSTAIKAL